MVTKQAKKWGSLEPAGLVSYARIRSRPLRLYFPSLPCFPRLPSRAAARILEGSLLISQTAFYSHFRTTYQFDTSIEIQEERHGWIFKSTRLRWFVLSIAPANHCEQTSLFLCTWSFFVFRSRECAMRFDIQSAFIIWLQTNGCCASVCELKHQVSLFRRDALFSSSWVLACWFVDLSDGCFCCMC